MRSDFLFKSGIFRGFFPFFFGFFLHVPLGFAEWTGAGSSFVYPLLAEWSVAYEQKTHTQINYQALGSAGGIEQLQNHTLQFAISDVPLTPTQLHTNQWQQFALVSGGIVFAFHLPGLDKKNVTLDGATLAAIFLGKIQFWDDAALTALNPGLPLPHLPIIVIHRADGSGTTFHFTHYLSQISPQWQAEVGTNTAVNWPTGIGGKANAGVASLIQRVPGSLGYLEYGFAKLCELPLVSLKNAAGAILYPSAATFSAALSQINWRSNHPEDGAQTPLPGKETWPLVATSFVVIPKSPAASALLQFFCWGLREQNNTITALDYLSLPATEVDRLCLPSTA